jgi:hypothetical protein
MCGPPGERTMLSMTSTDYIIDSLLVLLVLLQIREQRLTTKTIIRPLVLVGFAVLNYLHGIPTAGNDLELIACFALLGTTFGVASGMTMLMRRRAQDGVVVARAGWSSATLWVASMGSRFAFVYWLTHFGAHSIAHFSAAHSITSGETWTVSILAWALFEVVSRTVVLAARRERLADHAAAPVLA